MPEDVGLPKKNPPYPSSIFLEASRHYISLLSYLLGYPYDQFFYESILGFLSIFNIDKQPSFMYNYNQFLADNIHEQFMNLNTKGVFCYSSVIVHIFIFQHGDIFPLKLSKQDVQGVNQSMIHWIKIVRTTSTSSSFSDFIDTFIHPVAQLLYTQKEPRIGDEINRILHLSE